MDKFNTNNRLPDYSSINNGKINKGSLFSANPPSVNFLLILFTVSYFIVGADLCKEMAVEKNEIGFFTATLEDSFHFDSSAILSLLEQVPLDCGILPPVSYSIHNSDVELFPPGRSPPSA